MGFNYFHLVSVLTFPELMTRFLYCCLGEIKLYGTIIICVHAYCVDL